MFHNPDIDFKWEWISFRIGIIQHSVKNPNFFETFQRHVKERPKAIALQSIDDSGRESFSYEETNQRIQALSLFLKEQGVLPGDRVGLIMENGPSWAIAFLAGQSAGATLVPLDTLHNPQTLSKLIEHSGCRFLIVSQSHLEPLAEIQSSLSSQLPCLVDGSNESDYSNWRDAVGQNPTKECSLPLVPRDPQDPLAILYTSGTTGEPKGVVLSHQNIYRNVVELEALIPLSSEDHVLSVLPLYHVLALMTNLIIPLYIGAQVTYLRNLDPQSLLATFRDEGVTIFVCVPQYYYLVMRRIQSGLDEQKWLRRQVFSLLLRLSKTCNRWTGYNPGRFFFPPIHRPFGPRFGLFGVGGAHFDPRVAEAFRDLGFRLVQAYGMTETAALITASKINSPEPGSVGHPLPHVEVRIDNPNAEGIGEILVRGENVMLGYWKNERATRETIRENWLHTGDLGYRSKTGALYITGRAKDLIVLSSGKNLFPEEIEHHYQSQCEFIKEMCVVGIPDPHSNQDEDVLHAVVVPDFDQLRQNELTQTYDTIRYHIENLSAALPPHKHVKSLSIRREPLPRTTTRKIKRFQLMEELQNREETTDSAAPAYQPTDEIEIKCFEQISRLKPNLSPHPEMHLELDIGLSSLERVELLSNVSDALQIDISDAEGTQFFTVGEILEHVREKLRSAKVSDRARTQLSWTEILRQPLSHEEQERLEDILSPSLWRNLVIDIVAAAAFLLAKVLFRMRIEGRENLPEKTPFLICPNHLSYLDPILLASSLPRSLARRTFYLGYSQYFSGAMYGLARLFKVFPVDAERHLRQALRLGANGLQQGFALCIFPEGGRSIDGNLLPFRQGPAVLASELNVPIVPVGIVGTLQIWPRGSGPKGLAPVIIRFGAPLQSDPGSKSYQDINSKLRSAVFELIEPPNAG